jgi:hypothetical protein
MPQDLATIDQTPWGRLIDRAISERDFPIANIESLWRMSLEREEREQRRAYNVAMAATQAEMVPVLRATQNTHLHTKYASYDDISRAMKPIYSAHGFSVTFATEVALVVGNIRVVCVVHHSDGWDEKNLALEAPPDTSGSQGKLNKTPVQAVGSTVSFLRRYLLCMAFDIVLANDDDDGEGSRRPPPRQPPGNATGPRDPLAVDYGPPWVANLSALVASAASLDRLAEIRGHPRVATILDPKSSLPANIRGDIDTMFRDAAARLAPPADRREEINRQVPIEPPAADGESWRAAHPDPVVEAMLVEIGGMDLTTLSTLSDNADWSRRVRAIDFPLDQDIVRETVEARIVELKARTT